jgi:ATP-dependent Lhr-like helicase
MRKSFFVMIDHASTNLSAMSDGRRDKLRHLLRRFFQSRGPVTITQIQERYPLGRQEIEAILAELAQAGVVYRGQLTPAATEEQWCDRRNFEQLYRRAIQERRRAFAPQPAENYLRFLWRWHGISRLQSAAQLLPLLQRLRGWFFPLDLLEREILRARIPFAQFSQLFAPCHLHLAALCQQGELIWRLYQEDKGHARLVQFFLRGEGHWFYSREQLAEQASQLSTAAQTVREFLKENGASFFRDLVAGTSLPKTQLVEALAELAWRGLATNDSLQVLNELAEHGIPRPDERSFSDDELASPSPASSTPPPSSDWQNMLEATLPEWRKRSQGWRRRQYSRQREQFRRALKQMPQLSEGRWSLAESFAIFGKPATTSNTDGRSLAQHQALLLLERHGILVKEWHRREIQRAQPGWLPWYMLFQALKQMEWRGEVRRGYFVEGLSGVQFALPHALERFAAKEAPPHDAGPVMLSVLDPAVPYGSGVNLALLDSAGQPLSLTRQAGNHLLWVNAKPVVYAENYGARLWSLAGATDEQLANSLACLRQLLLLPESLRPRKRIESETWNGAPITTTPAAIWLQQHGFEKEEQKMVLWPSRA